MTKIEKFNLKDIQENVGIGLSNPQTVYVRLYDILNLIEKHRGIYEHTQPLQDLRHEWFDAFKRDLKQK